MGSIVRRLPLFLSLAALAGCAATTVAPQETEIPEIRPGILQGYLPMEAYPNSLAFLPPPPPENSLAAALDGGLSEEAMQLAGTDRWLLASADNELMFPAAAGTFSCALDAPVTEADTPTLYRLLRRSLADAGLATYSAKNHYQRRRPFLSNSGQVCVSDEERHHLEDDGSYPSGHTAIGWAWALILAELAPDRTDALIARGWAFGQSRMICNVHWQSDVDAGRLVGAAVVARLHTDPVFLGDLEAARAELAAVREGGLPPTRDCAAEAQSLAVGQ